LGATERVLVIKEQVAIGGTRMENGKEVMGSREEGRFFRVPV